MTLGVQGKQKCAFCHIIRQMGGNAMLEEILNRRSCRDFDPNHQVEDEKLNQIIQAGLLAPTGVNRQGTEIIVIQDKKVRDELSALNGSIMGTPNDPFYGAPTVCLVIARKSALAKLDGGACIENMLLEATHQGVNSCWIHRGEEEIASEEGRRILSSTGIDFEEYIGIGHVILGYSLGARPKEKAIREGRVHKI